MIQNSRWKIEDYARKKSELLSELAKYEENEQLTRDSPTTIGDLKKEKDEHSEIIQTINQVRIEKIFPRNVGCKHVPGHHAFEHLRRPSADGPCCNGKSQCCHPNCRHEPHSILDSLELPPGYRAVSARRYNR